MKLVIIPFYEPLIDVYTLPEDFNEDGTVEDYIKNKLHIDPDYIHWQLYEDDDLKINFHDPKDKK